MPLTNLMRDYREAMAKSLQRRYTFPPGSPCAGHTMSLNIAIGMVGSANIAKAMKAKIPPDDAADVVAWKKGLVSKRPRGEFMVPCHNEASSRGVRRVSSPRRESEEE